jgi:hypothetical protein
LTLNKKEEYAQMKGIHNIPQESKDKGFASVPRIGVAHTKTTPFLDALFDARTTSSAIGGALIGNMVATSLGAVVGGLVGGTLGFLSSRREYGKAVTE